MSESTQLQTPLRRPLRGPHVGYMDNTAEHLARTSDAWLLILGWCERVTPWITNNQEEVVAEGEPISPPPGADDKPRRWFRLSLQTRKERHWAWRVSANNAALALINDTEIPSLPNGSPLWLTRFFGLLHEVQGQQRARQRRPRTWRRPSFENLQMLGLDKVAVHDLPDEMLLVLYWQERAWEWERRSKNDVLALLSAARDALKTYGSLEATEAAAREGAFSPEHPLAQDANFGARVHLVSLGIARLQALQAVNLLGHGKEIPPIPISDPPPWMRRLFHLLERLQARKPVPSSPIPNAPHVSGTPFILPAVTSAFRDGTATLPSSLPVQGLFAALHAAPQGIQSESRQGWQQTEDGQRWFPYQKASGTVVTSWSSPGGAMMTQDMADVLTRKFQAISDLDGDVLTACLVQYMEHHGPDGLTSLDATTILDYRGIEPIKHRDGKVTRRAGHRTEDIRDIAASMDRLTCLNIDLQRVEVWETVEGKKSKARNYITHKSKVLSIEDWWEQTSVMGASGLPIRWSFRMGGWLVPFLQGSRQTAQFLQKILEYDPYREVWEKRLGRYLTIQFRIGAKETGALRRGIGTLLAECWLPVDAANPQRTKDRLSKALDRLTADGVIGGWTDELENGKNPVLPARKWLPTWKTWMIVFTPPHEADVRYKKAGEKHRALRAQATAQRARPRVGGQKGAPAGR